MKGMTQRPDVTVLMPTYNDSKYVAGAISSVLSQSCANWELILIDDGSTDDTPKIIRQFADSRILHLRQENSGQLNALTNGSQHVRGKYVTILHSDDELLDNHALERSISALENCDGDGIFSDHVKIDESGEINGRAKTASAIDKFSPAILFLRGGSNLTTDAFFVNTQAFENVVSTYMLWNMPYWLKLGETRAGVLKLSKTEPWYKYRVYSENYARSAVGRFEAANGCLRTVVELGQRLDLPFAQLQRLLMKATGARLKPLFRSNRSSPHNLRGTIRDVVERYFQSVPQNIYFEGLMGFYVAFPSNRTANMSFEEDDRIFLGKDARLFFNLMERKHLPAVYESILEDAIEGFGRVVVKDRESYDKARNVIRFLNLCARVEIG